MIHTDVSTGVQFPTLGDLSNPGIKPVSLAPPALAGGFFTTVPPGKPYQMYSLQMLFSNFIVIPLCCVFFFFFFAVQNFIVDVFSHVYF